MEQAIASLADFFIGPPCVSPLHVSSFSRFLLDEREDSINDGYFVVDMNGFVEGDGSKMQKLVDYPAAYHNGAAGIAFADGHSEIKRWKDKRTFPNLRRGVELSLNVPSPSNASVSPLLA